MNKTTLFIDRPHIKPQYLISADDLTVIETLQAIHYPFAKNSCECVKERDIVCIDIRRSGAQYIITCQSETYETADPVYFIENLIYQNSAVDDAFYALHAAAVGYQGRAYVLSGVTEAGKTTLSAYLTQKGLDYLTDDCVLIRRDDLSVLPFRKAMQIRCGGMDVLKKAGITLHTAVTPEVGRAGRYVHLPETPAREQYTLGGILFILRSPNENNHLRLSPVQSIELLMKNALRFEKPGPHLLTVLSRISTKGCYSVVYSDMDYVLQTITAGAYD